MLAAVVLVVLGLLLGGCGGDEGATPARAGSSTTPTTTSVPGGGTTSPAPTQVGTTTSMPGAPPSTRRTTGTTAAPATSVPGPSSTAPPTPVRTPASSLGFGEIAFTIVPPGGTAAGAAQRCALLAETDQQLARGLMGRRDLAGYDAMVFRFALDTSGPFYMRNVPVPLSIAWFAADGRYVAATDMAPCPDREGCPLYSPGNTYRYAVEVLEGGLAPLGISGGSVLSLGGACAG